MSHIVLIEKLWRDSSESAVSIITHSLTHSLTHSVTLSLSLPLPSPDSGCTAAGTTDQKKLSTLPLASSMKK